MRVGTRIKELCAALEGMGSATAAEIHQAAFPELDVNLVRTYCSRSVGLGFATVDAFMHQAAAQGKYVAAMADAMLVPAPSRNEVNRVARMAEDLIDTTTALLSVLRGRMRKAPGGES